MVHGDAGHHSQLLKGLLDMCLLSVISTGPSYGYEMVRQLNDRGLEIAGETSIYPVLRRLKNQNLVESYLEDSPSGPARKYYRITPAGRKLLTDWADDWQTVRNGVDDVLRDRS
ncbi:MAG: PadR family transcriptional regulator [Acidimicrobiia bacterium]|nr:PadR family transcriptional regulator [Acidimicrobiia bacterium]